MIFKDLRAQSAQRLEMGHRSGVVSLSIPDILVIDGIQQYDLQVFPNGQGADTSPFALNNVEVRDGYNLS